MDADEGADVIAMDAAMDADEDCGGIVKQPVAVLTGLSAEDRMAFLHWLRANDVADFKAQSCFRSISAQLATEAASWSTHPSMEDVVQLVLMRVAAHIKPEWMMEVLDCVEESGADSPDLTAFFSEVSNLNPTRFLRLRCGYVLELSKFYVGNDDRKILDALSDSREKLRILGRIDAGSASEIVFNWLNILGYARTSMSAPQDGEQPTLDGERMLSFVDNQLCNVGLDTQEQFFMDEAAEAKGNGDTENDKENKENNSVIANTEGKENVPVGAGRSEKGDEKGDEHAAADDADAAAATAITDSKKSRDPGTPFSAVRAAWMKQFVPADDAAKKTQLRAQTFVRQATGLIEDALYSQSESCDDVPIRFTWKHGDKKCLKSQRMEASFSGKDIDSLNSCKLYFSGDILPEMVGGGLEVGSIGSFRCCVTRPWRWLVPAWTIPGGSEDEITCELKSEEHEEILLIGETPNKVQFKVWFLQPIASIVAKCKQQKTRFAFVRPMFPTEEKGVNFRKDHERARNENSFKDYVYKVAKYTPEAPAPKEKPHKEQNVQNVTKGRGGRVKKAEETLAVADRWSHMRDLSTY